METLRVTSGSWAGRVAIHFDTIDSTNEAAKRIYAAYKNASLEDEKSIDRASLKYASEYELAQAAKLESKDLNGLLLYADTQTAGKGRRGREWKSPKGGSIAYSVLLVPKEGLLPIDRAPMMTPIMAMVASEVLNEYYKIESRIKWPNDIVLENKKLSGTLTEMSVTNGRVDYIIVGTGINIGAVLLPDELSQTGITLEKRYSDAEILSEIMKRFGEACEEFYKAGSIKPLKERYERLLVNLGKLVRVLDPKGEYSGKAMGISDTGELLVSVSKEVYDLKPESRYLGEASTGDKNDSKEACGENKYILAVNSGEVSVRGVYGYAV